MLAIAGPPVEAIGLLGYGRSIGRGVQEGKATGSDDNIGLQAAIFGLRLIRTGRADAQSSLPILIEFTYFTAAPLSPAARPSTSESLDGASDIGILV
jgi:hypothetical protein